MNSSRSNIPLGEVLLESGLLTASQLEAALERQETLDIRLGELLVAEGVLTQSSLVEALGRCLGVQGCVLRHGMIDPHAVAELRESDIKRLNVLPMFLVRDTLTVAMTEPQSVPTIDLLQRLTRYQIRPVLVLQDNLREFISKYVGQNVKVDAFLASFGESDVQIDGAAPESDEAAITDIAQMVDGSPIVNLVNFALLSAVRDGASDIHIEPSRTGTLVRYRIDGRLRELMRPPLGMHSAIVARIKVIGQMDIAEKRVPQEGRIRIAAADRPVDLRVSSMPTLLGEKLVIRILDKSNLNVRMEALGFRPQDLEAVQRMLGQVHGLVLVTGPTGSGKTTTLYSALDLLATPDLNIVTVEDPVEYQLDLINQIQVHESVGLSFARALRSILRQDPDIIMVGEIRDAPTAEVAVQASLTGHLVLATLHTNDASGAAARLIDMGVEPYLLSSALVGVVAQRLVRTNCNDCSARYIPSEVLLRDAGLDASVRRTFKKGAGCQNCHNSGFRGRLGVYEVLEVTDSFRSLITRSRPSHEIRRNVRKSGVASLREQAVHLAVAGKTSLEEALRVTRMESGLDEDTPLRSAAESGVAA